MLSLAQTKIFFPPDLVKYAIMEYVTIDVAIQRDRFRQTLNLIKSEWREIPRHLCIVCTENQSVSLVSKFDTSFNLRTFS